MLRPSRPMMRPFRSSLGRSTTETVVSMACSAPQRWMASVMYCLARSTAVSRASASSRFSRFAESCRASLSICRISSSFASSAVRLATRSSSCCCCATSCSYFVGGGRGRLLALGERAVAARCSSFSSRSIAAWRSADRRFAPRQRLLERRRLLAVLARLALGLHQDVVRLLLGLEQRFFLAGFGVALGVLDDAQRPVLRRGRSVSAAIRLRLATQTANIAAATTTVTTAGTMTFAKSGNTRDVLSRRRDQTPAAEPRAGELATKRLGGSARAKGPALPCGEVDEPAKAGGTAQKAALQASSLQRHAHHAASRLTWVNIGSTSHPPSRAKQGTQTLESGS